MVRVLAMVLDNRHRANRKGKTSHLTSTYLCRLPWIGVTGAGDRESTRQPTRDHLWKTVFLNEVQGQSHGSWRALTVTFHRGPNSRAPAGAEG